MLKFIGKHADHISGIVSGFDRLVFRGSLHSIAHKRRDEPVLGNNGILLKNFGSHNEHVSHQLNSAGVRQCVRRPR